MFNLSENKRLFYLKRINSPDSKYAIIPLKKHEVSIGRQKTSDSIITDESISRKHAVFKYDGNSWSVVNFSSNGVFVDGVGLSKLEEKQIEIGQTIQLGLGSFCFRLGVKETKSLKHAEKTTNLRENHIAEKDALANRLQFELDEMQKKHEEAKQQLQEHILEEVRRNEEAIKEKEEIAKKSAEEKRLLQAEFQKERDQLEKKLAEEKGTLEQKLSCLEVEMSSLVHQIQEQDLNLKQRETEQENLYGMLKHEADSLAAEKLSLKVRLQEVETSLDDKVLLTATMAAELAEKQKIEEKLAHLEKEKEDCDTRLRIAEEKEGEIFVLRDSLDILKAQKMTLEDQLAVTSSTSENAKQEVLDSVSNLVENEFQCPICCDLFITAIMLNCSHTFCQFCINSWKKTKRECPQCRTKIVSETRSLVVDNFIERMVASLSEEAKEQRQKVIKERQAEIEKEKEDLASKNAAAAASRGRRSSRRGRGRGRGRAAASSNRGRNSTNVTHTNFNNRNNAGASNAPDVIPLMNLAVGPGSSARQPIDVDDASRSSVDSNLSAHMYGSSSSSVSGDSSVFYGGYGRCYTCGRTGHWANGCPDRYW